MILLEISFFRHYVFAVVQTASKPHPTRGQTTLTAHAKQKLEGGRDAVDGTQTPSLPPALHNRDGCATFKPHAILSVKVATL